MGIRNVPHPANVYKLVHDPAGGIARDMLRRGLRVQAQARRNLAGANGRPRRIATGNLRSSIYNIPIMTTEGPGARIGTFVKYALLVHNGTGLYGPRHRRITPKRAKFLVFTPKGARGKVFARSVKGMPPNPFLTDALPAAKG